MSIFVVRTNFLYRATSAASTFFEPITIGPHCEIFVDGATGANNPIREVWTAAMDMWPATQYGPLNGNIKCLVSIGTGVPSLKAFGDSVLEVGKTLLKISTETEGTAESFVQEHSDMDDENRYFRFNVLNGLGDIGLEEYKRMGDIAAATRQYIQTQDVFKKMKACGNNLAGRERTSMVSSICMDLGSRS